MLEFLHFPWHTKHVNFMSMGKNIKRASNEIIIQKRYLQIRDIFHRQNLVVTSLRLIWEAQNFSVAPRIYYIPNEYIYLVSTCLRVILTTLRSFMKKIILKWRNENNLSIFSKRTELIRRERIVVTLILNCHYLFRYRSVRDLILWHLLHVFMNAQQTKQGNKDGTVSLM